MDTTAKQIANRARKSITTLSTNKAFGTLSAVYEALSRHSGLSVSWIAKFNQGAKDNPTQDTLDGLVESINAISQEAA